MSESISLPKESNETVYRTFTFFNKNYYDNSGISTSYVTLGFFDAFQTELVDKRNVKSETFEPLWNKSVELSMGATNSTGIIDCSYQNIFGFCKNIESNISDEIFWSSSSDKEYPVTFIILVQFISGSDFNYDISIHDKINHIQAVFSDLQKSKEIIMYSYLTLDKFDAIICIKSKEYNNIAKKMTSICAGNRAGDFCKLNDIGPFRTYTVVAFSNFVINNIDEIIINDTLSSVSIKGVFYPSSPFTSKTDIEEKDSAYKVQNLLSSIHNILFPDSDKIDIENERCYSMFGDEDVRYIARNVDLKKFIKLFASNTANYSFSLHSENLGFSRFDSDINSLISFSEDSYGTHNLLPYTPTQAVRNHLNYLGTMIKSIDNYIDTRNKTLKKAIYQLYSAFYTMAYSPIRDYEFFSLFYSFYAILENINIHYLRDQKLYGSQNVKIEEPNCTANSYCEKILSLLLQISSSHFVSMRSDIRSFQVSNYHINLFYAPSKLRTFYSIYVYDVVSSFKNMCSNPKAKPNVGQFHFNLNCPLYDDYYFIINPGVYPLTSVKQIIDKEEIGITSNRIMICEMPERSIYLLKASLIQLTHEISHHGMSTVRSRVQRYSFFSKGCLYALLNFYKITLYEKIAAPHFYKKFIHLEKTLGDTTGSSDSRNETWEALSSLWIKALFNPRINDELFDILSKESVLYSSPDLDGKYINEYVQNNSGEYDDVFLMDNMISYLSQNIFLMTSNTLSNSLSNKLSTCVTKFFINELYKSNLINLIFPSTNIKQSISAEAQIFSLVTSCTKGIICTDVHESILGLSKTNAYSSYFMSNYKLLYKECYADLVTVITLNLSLSEYMDSFCCKDDSDTFGEDDTIAIIRVAAIIIAVFEYNKNMPNESSKVSNWAYMNDCGKIVFPVETKLPELTNTIILRRLLGIKFNQQLSDEDISVLDYTTFDDSDSDITKIESLLVNIRETHKQEYSKIPYFSNKYGITVASSLFEIESIFNQLVEYLVLCAKNLYNEYISKNTTPPTYIKIFRDLCSDEIEPTLAIEVIEKYLCDFEKNQM